jgi:hypothetical protein
MDKIKMCNLGVKGRGVRFRVLVVLLLVLFHVCFLPLLVSHVDARTHNGIWLAFLSRYEHQNRKNSGRLPAAIVCKRENKG